MTAPCRPLLLCLAISPAWSACAASGAPPEPATTPAAPKPTTEVVASPPGPPPEARAPEPPASAEPPPVASASAPLPAPSPPPSAVPPGSPPPKSSAKPAPAAGYSGADPCQTTSFHVGVVGAACKQGGRAAAKQVMKGAIQKAKAAGTDLQCTSCHENLRTFRLKGNAVADLEKWL